MIGDQVYVDEDAPKTREFIRSRRDTSRPPGEEVLDFEEYTRLYWETWGEPVIRWLLSTVGDRDDLRRPRRPRRLEHVDAWVEEMRSQGLVGDAHRGRADVLLGLPAPRQPVAPPSSSENELLAQVRRPRTAARCCGSWARQAPTTAQRQPLELQARPRRRADGRVRLARGARARAAAARDERRPRVGVGRGARDRGLRPPAARGHAADPARARRSTTSRRGTRRVCGGAWGELGDGLRREAAARARPGALGGVQLLVQAHRASSCARSRSGERGEAARDDRRAGRRHPPRLPRRGRLQARRGVQSAVYQAVCSPFRNPLDRHERARSVRAGASRAAERSRARCSHARPACRTRRSSWRLVQKPTFDNQFATIELEGRSAMLRIERTVAGRRTAATG